MKKIALLNAVLLAACTAMAADVAVTCPVSANCRGHEDTEWSRAYGYDMVRGAGRPRVLLVGDSITCEYADRVRKILSGKVNVSYWASSYCVTSPGYLKLLEHQLAEAKFDVVHFNNGLHSLDTPPAAYGRAMAAALRLIRAKQPKAKIVWVSSTPLKDPKLTKKAQVLNAAGLAAAREVGVDSVDDLFSLADPLDRATYWSDCFHHKSPLVGKLADRVAETVLAQALGQTAE